MNHFLRIIDPCPHLFVLVPVHGEVQGPFPIFGGGLFGLAVPYVIGACQSCTQKLNQVAAWEAELLSVSVEKELLTVISFNCQAVTRQFKLRRLYRLAWSSRISNFKQQAIEVSPLEIGVWVLGMIFCCGLGSRIEARVSLTVYLVFLGLFVGV